MSGKSSKYRYRMALQTYTETRSGAGQMVKAWSDLADLWCSRKIAYKGEEMLGGIRQSKTPKMAAIGYFEIGTRYRTDIAFSPRYRVRHGTRIFEIIAVEASAATDEVTMLCMEVQP